MGPRLGVDPESGHWLSGVCDLRRRQVWVTAPKDYRSSTAGRLTCPIDGAMRRQPLRLGVVESKECRFPSAHHQGVCGLDPGARTELSSVFGRAGGSRTRHGDRMQPDSLGAPPNCERCLVPMLADGRSAHSGAARPASGAPGLTLNQHNRYQTLAPSSSYAPQSPLFHLLLQVGPAD